jgi:hypothetical protein
MSCSSYREIKLAHRIDRLGDHSLVCSGKMEATHHAVQRQFRKAASGVPENVDHTRLRASSEDHNPLFFTATCDERSPMISGSGSQRLG